MTVRKPEAFIEPADVDMLRVILRLDSETGNLFWRHRDPAIFTGLGMFTEHECRRWNARYAGTQALNSNCKGYRAGRIFSRSCFAHRVVWAITHGFWPTSLLDHINRDTSDNRPSNLRLATQSENIMNAKIQENNTSGFKGVCWAKRQKKWHAYIKCRGARFYLGYHATAELAASAVSAKRAELHGEFGRDR